MFRTNSKRWSGRIKVQQGHGVLLKVIFNRVDSEVQVKENKTKHFHPATVCCLVSMLSQS